eukprot:797255-Pyramimonas_sp.AAC.1
MAVWARAGRARLTASLPFLRGPKTPSRNLRCRGENKSFYSFVHSLGLRPSPPPGLLGVSAAPRG